MIQNTVPTYLMRYYRFKHMLENKIVFLLSVKLIHCQYFHGHGLNCRPWIMMRLINVESLMNWLEYLYRFC